MPDRAFVLCCESTTDASERFHADRDIQYVYFNYMLDDEPCKDDFGKTHAPAELYRLMLEGAEARTSQVSAGDYIDFWRPFLENGQDVLHVAMSSGISGTYNSACTARDHLAPEFPDRKIVVVDSLCASGSYALLMDMLARLRNQGLSVDGVAAWAEEHRLEAHTWFFSSDLTFYVRGGRISKAAGLIGGALKICPILHIEHDGSLAVVEKIRTKKKSVARVVEIMHQVAQGGENYSDIVISTNSDCLDDAKMLGAAVEKDFPQLKSPVMYYDIGATIGCHTGPGTASISYWGAPRTPRS